ncbi:membrane protein [Neisseria arctica]|uniref:Membrane protein n=1 Tax=Neisseria arctica TaxID=1470200 RepID=A0A0J0YQN8_9NEIS|nr:trimeric porin PorB [Neisseria arctica]KLT72445.1 membrane protein [Neisseria arctica]UOO86344.1 trimeric porin PorB [Neisseria arctica]
MKKTLIALTLAALPVAASADVILYGQIKAGVEVAQTKVTVDGVSEKSDTTTQIADFGSRIGFKGHEHLGSGLNAIWQVENNVSVAGGGTWAGRDSFIGLEGNFGKVRAGKLSTQLNDMGTVDPWEYNNNALGLGMFTRTGKRVTSVRYDSPVFAGFSGNVQYTPRDNGTEVRGLGVTTGRDDEASDTSGYYAGLNYENAGFFAQYGVGYKKSAYIAGSGESKSGQAHRVEAGYDANNLFVGLGYQYTNGWDSYDSYLAALASDSEYDAAADNSVGIKAHEVAATAAYRFGNVTPRVSYAHGFKVKGAELTDAERKAAKYDQIVLGADYDFSKRTTAMVSAGWLKAGSGDNKTQTTAGLVGLRHKF